MFLKQKNIPFLNRMFPKQKNIPLLNRMFPKQKNTPFINRKIFLSQTDQNYKPRIGHDYRVTLCRQNH